MSGLTTHSPDSRRSSADVEYVAARQELDDVIADACKEIH